MLTSASYRPSPQALPLCFLKVMKTGSESVMPWLTSMFPVDQVAPYRNTIEFETHREGERSYQLYAGHIIGGQLERLPAAIDVLTILREPAEAALSRYYHRRNVVGIEPELARLCRSADFATVIRERSPLALYGFREALTRQLGATFADYEAEGSLADAELADVRARQRSRAAAILGRAILVGEHRDIEGATLLLAAMRGWAAPPFRPRIHDYGAPTRQDAADPSIRAILDTLLPTDHAIYTAARESFASVRRRLAELCGAATPEAVDAHHRRRFFAETPQLEAFWTTADAGWSGAGWGVRESDGLGNLYRQISGERATTLMNLRADDRPRRIALGVWNAGSEAALDGLTVSVADRMLPAAGRRWRGRELILEWRLPAELVQGQAGHVELALRRAPAGGSDPLWFSGLGCATETSRMGAP